MKPIKTFIACQTVALPENAGLNPWTATAATITIPAKIRNGLIIRRIWSRALAVQAAGNQFLATDWTIGFNSPTTVSNFDVNPGSNTYTFQFTKDNNTFAPNTKVVFDANNQIQFTASAFNNSTTFVPAAGDQITVVLFVEFEYTEDVLSDIGEIKEDNFAQMKLQGVSGLD